MSFGTDDDGSWWARIRLHADEGQIVEAGLRATRDRLHEGARAAAKERAEAEGRPTTGTDAELGVAKVGWADALVGMSTSVLGSDASGAERSTTTAVVLHLERPSPDDMPTVAPYQGPTGERLDPEAVYFTRRPSAA